MDRKTLNGILTKYGISDVEDLPDERAEKKLGNRVAKGEFPPNLTKAEIKSLSDEGITVPPETQAQAIPTAPTKTAPDPAEKRRYGVRAPDGSWQRIDNITSVKASVRNMNRNDGRKWEPVPDGEDVPLKEEEQTEQTAPAEEEASDGKDAVERGTEDPTSESAGEGSDNDTDTTEDTPSPKGSPTMKTKKIAKKTEPQALTPQKAQKAAERAAAEKAKPKAAGKTASKPKAPTKKKAAGDGTNAKAFGNDQKDRKVNSSQIFRDTFATDKVMKKTAVVEGMMKKGIKPATVSSYLVWAKRKDHGTPNVANPWGFVITETIDDKGVKSLQRTGVTKGAPKSKADKADKKK